VIDADFHADRQNQAPEPRQISPRVPPDDLTMLDILAFVVGAALASVHLRPALRVGWEGRALVLPGLAFMLIAITATGPVLLAVRKLTGRLVGWPGIGEILWCVIGAPWVTFAPLADSSRGTTGNFAAMWLAISLIVVSMVALVTVWATWVDVSPDRASVNAGPPWSNRLGMILSIAWPLQWAAGLMVLAG
jgi:hypothetical protein